MEDKLILRDKITKNLSYIFLGNELYTNSNDPIIVAKYFNCHSVSKNKTSNVDEGEFIHITEDNKIIELIKNNINGKTFYFMTNHPTKYDNVIKYNMLSIYFLCNVTMKNSVVSLYKKSPTVPIELWSPPSLIKEIHVDKKKYNVIRDDIIPGGSKTRSGLPFMRETLNDFIKEVHFVSAPNGYGQVALAYVLYLLKKTDIILNVYTQPYKYNPCIDDEIKTLRKLSLYYHAKTNFIVISDKRTRIIEMIKEKIGTQKEHLFLPIGFNHPTFVDMFKDSLKQGLGDHINRIKRLWVAIGSGALLASLQKIMPHVQFMAVQTGGNVYIDEMPDPSKITLYKSSYRFLECVPESIAKKIPYPTLFSYDGKLWEFIMKHGVDDDWIFNVGGIHKFFSQL